MDALLAGDALSEEVDDPVRGWREAGSRLPLREHLGMTPEEYALWSEQPRALDLVAHARKHGTTLERLNRDGELHRLAARSLRDDEVEKLLTWLRKNGHI